MNIGMFTDTFYEVNGVSRMINNLTDGLRKGGNKVKLFVPGIGKDDAVHFPGLSLPSAPEYTFGIPDALKTFNAIKKNQIEVIHAHSPFSIGLCAIFAKKMFKLPAIGTFHTLYPEWMHYLFGSMAEYSKKPAWAYLKHIYDQFDVVVSPSRAVQKVLTEKGIKSIVIPNGINLLSFTPKNSKTPFVKKFGIKGNVFLSVGRIAKEKRLEMIVDAAKRSKDRFAIVGKGPYEGTIKEYAKGMKTMLFTGYLDDPLLRSAYAAATAFILCSQTETQGLVCLEAMASGTPAIAFDCDSNRETVGKGGLYFKTVDELKECIEKIKEPKTRAKLSKLGLKQASKFSVEAMVDRYMKLYRRIQ